MTIGVSLGLLHDACLSFVMGFLRFLDLKEMSREIQSVAVTGRQRACKG